MINDRDAHGAVPNIDEHRQPEDATHKRKVYADLLGALRVDGAESSPVTRQEILRHISQAQIVANRELRERLHELAQDPQQLHDAGALQAFVEEIHADVRKTGEPT